MNPCNDITINNRIITNNENEHELHLSFSLILSEIPFYIVQEFGFLFLIALLR